MKQQLVGALMIVENGKLVGIFTERDALFRILAEGRDVGVIPAGLGARDTLRLESAMRRYGNDIDEHTSANRHVRRANCAADHFTPSQPKRSGRANRWKQRVRFRSLSCPAQKFCARRDARDIRPPRRGLPTLIEQSAPDRSARLHRACRE